MSRSHQENLALYAKLAIHGGVGLAKGQELILRSDIQNLPLVRYVVEEAYRSGAKNVQVIFVDEKVGLLRYEFGSDEAIEYAPGWLYNALTEAYNQNAASLAIISDDPNLLKSVSPDKIAKSSKAQGIAALPVSEVISGFKINWSLIGAPSPGWAKLVFPDLPVDEAMDKLWHSILYTSRVLESDPLETWNKHCNTLEAKKDELNKLQITELHFTGPGTDLTVGLANNAVWQGGWGYAKNGVKCGPNIPTEEVFTMPHRSNVNGVVSSTKPLSVRGQLIDKIQMEFESGAVTKASASVGEETLLKLIETDPGARRLGEVALVPDSCLVSQSKTLFFNTLYDENAASHIALGRCYSENMEGFENLSKEKQLEDGANDSLIHVDWMIGSSQIDVAAKTKSQGTISLMKNGEWTLEGH